MRADEEWFWQERWQQRESEVEDHVAAGELTVHQNTDEFLTYLDDAASTPSH